MAGFFDTLFGSETDPERRDYKRMDEITSPEELEAYRAGESATGSLIPGLDYARSMARGVKREITDPSMGPLGERYDEEMDRYRQRQEYFDRLNKMYPEAVRGGRLRGTEAIPGAEVAFMAQPAAAAAARALVRGSLRNAPQMAEREVAAFPRGWDLRAEGWQGVNPGRSSRTQMLPEAQTASPGEWPSLDTYNPGRTNKWRERVFKEPSINPHRSIAQEMGAHDVVPEAPAPVAGRTAAPRVQSPMLQSYWERAGNLPEATLNDLMRMRQTGEQPTAFRMNAINNALRKRGLSMEDFPPTAAAGINDPELQLAASVDENIANRVAAQAAKDERFARLPQVLQTNAFLKKANRLMEGGDEVRDLWLSRAGGNFRNVQPGEIATAMGESAGYKPPEVVRRWNERSTNLLPTRTQQAIDRVSPILERVNYNPKVGAAGAVGGGLGAATGAYLNQPSPVVEPRGTIPEWNPLAARTASTMATPSMDQLYGPGKVIAETARETTAPSRVAPRHAAPERVVRRHPAPVRRPAESNERYYGDWRDTEPFSTDPIGRFIDELTGRQKTSRTRGTNTRRGSLGDLLPFEHGGVVNGRRKFEDGGTDGGIPGLSDLGDALSNIGGLFGEGSSDTRAQDREDEESVGYTGMSPIKQALIAAGLGMMAASRPGTSIGESIGAGGLKGFELYQAAQKMQSDLRQKELARRQHAREMQLISDSLGDSGGPPLAADESEAGEEKATTPVGKLPVEMPSTTPSPTPSVAESTEGAAPISTADLKAPSGAPISPIKVAAEDQQTPAPSAKYDAALDSYIEKLREQHRRADKILPLVTDPSARAALANRQKSIEFEIKDLREQRDKAESARRAAEQEERLRKKEEREAYERSPKGLREKTAAEEAAKAEPKLIKSTREAALDAAEKMQSVDEVLNAYKTGKIHTSPGVQKLSEFVHSQFQEWAPDYDPTDPEAIKNTETLAGLGVADLMKKIGGSLGTAISEGDRKTIERMALGSDKSPESNKKMLLALKKVMLRATESKDFMDKYLEEHGMLDENYERELEKRFAEKPLFAQESEKKKTETSKSEYSAEDRARAAEILRRRREGSK